MKYNGLGWLVFGLTLYVKETDIVGDSGEQGPSPPTTADIYESRGIEISSVVSWTNEQNIEDKREF